MTKQSGSVCSRSCHRQKRTFKLTTTGHDWGCGSVSTFAAHYPEHCIATANLCVPYGILELGLEEILKTVDRSIYPEDEYPYGQWAYQVFYKSNAEQASAFFDSDIPAFLRASRLKANPQQDMNKPSALANTVKDGGWMGGAEKPDAKYRHIPLEMTVYESEESYQEFVGAMQKTGFWPGDAWYLNHARNRAYTLEKRRNEGILEFPVLFVSLRISFLMPYVKDSTLTSSARFTQHTTQYAPPRTTPR